MSGINRFHGFSIANEGQPGGYVVKNPSRGCSCSYFNGIRWVPAIYLGNGHYMVEQNGRFCATSTVLYSPPNTTIRKY